MNKNQLAYKWECRFIMKKWVIYCALMAIFLEGCIMNSLANEIKPLLDYDVERLHPRELINLKELYEGKVILVVNTASACGFTPQYETLEKLYQKYKDDGFIVLGFPSNDFFQERKTGDEIVNFCRVNYGVTFPIFKKSSVRGEKANIFYKRLAAESGDKFPRWNFYKYLIDKNQNVAGFFSSVDKPLGGGIEQEIKTLLER